MEQLYSRSLGALAQTEEGQSQRCLVGFPDRVWCICGQKPCNYQIFETLIAIVTGPLKAFEVNQCVGCCVMS